MNYRDEQTHDWLLIGLAKDLNRINRVDLLSTAFGIGDLGHLERAKRRKPFDVELTFSNISIVVETKVDSDEGGRWDQTWQTIGIANNADTLGYLKDNKVFIFLTYGTSEFYTKPYQQGAASPQFKHIGLDSMIDFVGSTVSLPLQRLDEYQKWLSLMRIEKQKRNNAVYLLQSFSSFRKQYLDIHGDIDFPNNRFTFCAPELAFPVLNRLVLEWNYSQHAKEFGRVSLYPVSRMSPPVHDSILNFWEMWDSGTPVLGTSILDKREASFYFEINEDFNLNLKLDSETLDDKTKNNTWDRLNKAQWPSFVKGHPRQYKQSTYVLYEFDFGFLQNLDNMPQVASNLSKTLEVAIKVLA